MPTLSLVAHITWLRCIVVAVEVVMALRESHVFQAHSLHNAAKLQGPYAGQTARALCCPISKLGQAASNGDQIIRLATLLESAVPVLAGQQGQQPASFPSVLILLARRSMFSCVFLLVGR